MRRRTSTRARASRSPIRGRGRRRAGPRSAAPTSRSRRRPATSDRLIAAKSPVAGAAELHNHIMEKGIARMRRVDAIAVPAGKSVVLKPGGYHLMLDRPQGAAEGGRSPQADPGVREGRRDRGGGDRGAPRRHGPARLRPPAGRTRAERRPQALRRAPAHRHTDKYASRSAASAAMSAMRPSWRMAPFSMM